jgi:hypothetical protein
MLGKILLTISIVLLGLVWVRQMRQHKRNEAAAAGRSLPGTSATAPAPALNDYRFAAWLFLALMLGLGGYLYYLQWQEDNTVVQILLHREGNSAPVTYEVRRKQLEARAFTTVEGVRVTVAASERMEVIGL